MRSVASSADITSSYIVQHQYQVVDMLVKTCAVTQWHKSLLLYHTANLSVLQVLSAQAIKD